MVQIVFQHRKHRSVQRVDFNVKGPLVNIQENALENGVCQMASICLSLNVLTHWPLGGVAVILY